MKLVHYHDVVRIRLRSPMIISCRSGMDMSSKMHKIREYCKKLDNDSTVIWESAHHQILLWFDDKKYESYFRMIGM
jgi:hypothetical protein